MAKKRHHFVPEGYLKHFSDGEGFVYVIRKDSPARAFRQKPDSVGFHKYYYAQPMPNGERDTDRLEDLFGELESKWPPIVDRLSRRDDVNDELEAIFQFIALQRARVPAMRDAIELIQAAAVKAMVKKMAAAGRLPSLPGEAPNLLDDLIVSIDPHRSILAMPRVLEEMGLVFDRIGLVALHNTTDVPFVSSDNPVMFFDPSALVDKLRPYEYDRSGGPLVLMMAVTPTLMLYGHSSDKPRFAQLGLAHADLSDASRVREINQMTCRFAYEAVFAHRSGMEEVVQPLAAKSPVVRIASSGATGSLSSPAQFEFGPRPSKPKWEGPRNVATDDPG